MKKNTLPQTDLEVSRACMGTMTFGSQLDLAGSRAIVNKCLDAGINFFDTANVYNQGQSEEIAGQCLGSERKNVILASKVRGAMGAGPEYVGLSRPAIRRAIDDSLRRLGTDYLDIYYLHQPDYETPIEETLDAMEELRREGKIRYVATSNYASWQIAEILWISEKKGYPPPVISQPMYNLLARGIEQEYLPFTRRFGVSVISYNPLAGGMLTGKQDLSSGPISGSRFDGNQMYLKRYWHDSYFDAVGALKSLAAGAGMSSVEMALAWVFHNPDVDSVLLGASRMEQLEENLRALERPALSAEMLSQCDEVWERLRGVTPKYNR